MGQDFVARKAAKKQRKRQARDAETGRKKRKRSKAGEAELAGELATHCCCCCAQNLDLGKPGLAMSTSRSRSVFVTNS